MKKTITQSQLLTRTEADTAILKALISDYSRFYRNNQGDFRGEKKTYETQPGYNDIPNNRYNKTVVTTVDEKVDYFVGKVEKTLSSQLALEATNASGNARAELIVEEESWGEFTSLELLRLKSFVGNSKLKEMISAIPVRSDSREWLTTEDDQYTDRSVVQTPVIEFEEKTTEKEEVVLEDPNVLAAINAGKDINYTPQKTVKTKQVIVGTGTLTGFSGEWTHRQRAGVLERLTVLHKSILDALQRANQVEIVESEMDTNKLLNFLFRGA